MNAVRKAYVDNPSGQIPCRIVPGIEPALLFLHQTATSSASYEPLLERLAALLPNRLVAIDTPGFGGSFDPQGWPSLSEYADQIIASTDALEIEAFHVFGHHTGASLAIEIADSVPDRTRTLMLAGPVFINDTERAEFAAGYGEPIALRRDGGHLLTTGTMPRATIPTPRSNCCTARCWRCCGRGRGGRRPIARSPGTRPPRYWPASRCRSCS